MGQRRAHHAGLAVVQAAHRVEQVGEAGRAGVQRGDAIVIAAGAVADLHADARVAQRADQRQVAGHSGASVSTLIGAIASAAAPRPAWPGWRGPAARPAGRG
jgi:hypothetical protein